MTPERKLAALFAAETPRTPDYAFQVEVARRIAVRRAWMTVGALLPWAVAATALLWALSPVIAPFMESLTAAIAPSAAVLVGAAAVGVGGLWLSRRFRSA